MEKSFEDLVGALRKSLQDQANASAPGMTDVIMAEIDAFDAELKKAVSAIAPIPPGEVNALGRFANGIAEVQAAIDDIEAGRCLPVAEGLVPSAGALNLCKTVIDLGAVALRTMALDFAAPIAEGEKPTEAEALIKVASGEGEGEILIKTLLPRDAAEALIVPPVVLAEELGAIALELLDEAGITPAELAKAFPPPKKKKPSAEEAPEGDEAPEGEGEGDEEEDEFEEDDEDAEDGEDPGEGTPLENVAKLAAGILIELDELTQMMPPQPDSMMAGDPAGAGMDPGADPAAGAGAEDGVMGAVQGMAHLAALIATQADALQAAVDSADDASADQYAEKVARVAELAKAAALKIPVALQAEGESLQKRASEAEKRAGEAEAALTKAHADLAALKERVDKLLGEPAPPKGAAMDVTAVTKAADQGADDADSPIARIEALRKSGRHEAVIHETFKAALATPLVGR